MGLIYHATIHFTKTIIGQPVTETVDASLNLLYVPHHTIPYHPHPLSPSTKPLTVYDRFSVAPDPTVLPGATDIDRRRVTSINELSQLKTGIIPL